jgi:tRNA(Leu) C34 or U34 (ribose-2'-O)-methylase TrmL
VNQSICIGLINPKSPTNVGAVMRAAGCYGANAVRYTGAGYARAARFHTDTGDAGLRIPLMPVGDITENLAAEVKIVCVELVEGAIALPAFVHPDHALYLFGPEDGSLDQMLIDRADSVVFIPTTGCMNLAATVNVVLYDRLAKSSDAAGSDQLIRQSRDTNNRVRVKAQIPADER